MKKIIVTIVTLTLTALTSCQKQAKAEPFCDSDTCLCISECSTREDTLRVFAQLRAKRITDSLIREAQKDTIR